MKVRILKGPWGASVGTIVMARGLRRLLILVMSSQDGDNINNYVEVLGDPASTAARARLMAEGGCMTEEERSIVVQFIEGLPA